MSDELDTAENDDSFVVSRTREIEQTLKKKFGVTGKGLGQIAENARKQIPMSTLKTIFLIAGIRNKVVHDGNALQSREKFAERCEDVMWDLRNVIAAGYTNTFEITFFEVSHLARKDGEYGFLARIDFTCIDGSSLAVIELEILREVGEDWNTIPVAGLSGSYARRGEWRPRELIYTGGNDQFEQYIYTPIPSEVNSDDLIDIKAKVFDVANEAFSNSVQFSFSNNCWV